MFSSIRVVPVYAEPCSLVAIDWTNVSNSSKITRTFNSITYLGIKKLITRTDCCRWTNRTGIRLSISTLLQNLGNNFMAFVLTGQVLSLYYSLFSKLSTKNNVFINNLRYSSFEVIDKWSNANVEFDTCKLCCVARIIYILERYNSTDL